MKLSDEIPDWYDPSAKYWATRIKLLEEGIRCLRIENVALKREIEGLRNGISLIIADSLGDDTSVDWIRIQLNRLLVDTQENQDIPCQTARE